MCITEHHNTARALNALDKLLCVVNLNKSFQRYALQQLDHSHR